MALGKLVRIFHRANTATYSVLVEHKLCADSVLLEAQAVAVLSPAETDAIRRQYTRHSEAYGWLGVLEINSWTAAAGADEAADSCRQLYLVLVTGCASVGRLSGVDIYRITQVALVALHKAAGAGAAGAGAPAAGGAAAADDERLADLRRLLGGGTFYFMWSSAEGASPNFTLCEQRKFHHCAATEPDAECGSDWQRRQQLVNSTPDNRFLWNRQLLGHLQRFGVDCDRWLLKVICGAVEVRTVYAGASRGQVCLVARLSGERAGTRFQVRGCCDSGHVANFVEIEQALHMTVADGVEWRTAHLQVRGSVPLFWEQPGVQVGSHKVRVTRGDACATPALRRHLRLLKRRYGAPLIVNLLSGSLVGSRSDEAVLSARFQARHAALSQHSDIEHVLFDYHLLVRSGAGGGDSSAAAAAGSSSSDQLQQLRQRLLPRLEQHGIFVARGDSVLQRQSGAVRTNCLDCLDRTNCVQSMIGQSVLPWQLAALQLDERSTAALAQRAGQLLRDMWLSAGNEISRMYAGTGALGSGGSRLMDGARSVSRTIQNNLMDGAKQTAIDLLLAPGGLSPPLAERARVLLPPGTVSTAEPLLVRRLCQAQDHFCRYQPLHVTVGTYNVNGGRHFRSVAYKDHGIEQWLLQPPPLSPDGATGCDAAIVELDPAPASDIYAVAFQEIVDLNASNMMAASSDNAKLWEAELERALSGARGGACGDGSGGGAGSGAASDYVLVTSVQLVGVALFVFVRGRLAPHVREVVTDTVKTGLGGATGNKGGVAVSLVLFNTSLCFIAAHLAAGQKEVSDRNSDYADIVRRLSFANSRSAFSHDYVTFCGDFNYRLDLPRDQVLELIGRRDWRALLQHDQLSKQRDAGHCFAGFIEGAIQFAPTYKFDLFSDDYDTGEKCRCPAWTDRVLVWQRQRERSGDEPSCAAGQLTPRVLYYGSAPLRQSDHRPVVCRLQLQLRRADSEQRRATLHRLVDECGPPDSTVLLQCADLFALSERPDFMAQLLAALARSGRVLLVRFPAVDSLAVTLADGGQALAVVRAAPLHVLEWQLSAQLLTADWRQQVLAQLARGGDNTLPLFPAGASASPDAGKSDVSTDDEAAPNDEQCSALTAADVWSRDFDGAPIKPLRPLPPVDNPDLSKSQQLSAHSALSSEPLKPDNISRPLPPPPAETDRQLPPFNARQNQEATGRQSSSESPDDGTPSSTSHSSSFDACQQSPNNSSGTEIPTSKTVAVSQAVQQQLSTESSEGQVASSGAVPAPVVPPRPLPTTEAQQCASEGSKWKIAPAAQDQQSYSEPCAAQPPSVDSRHAPLSAVEASRPPARLPPPIPARSRAIAPSVPSRPSRRPPALPHRPNK